MNAQPQFWNPVPGRSGVGCDPAIAGGGAIPEANDGVGRRSLGTGWWSWMALALAVIGLGVPSRAAAPLTFSIQAAGGTVEEVRFGEDGHHTITMNVDCNLALIPTSPSCGDPFRATRGQLIGRIRFWGSATDHAGVTYNFDIDGPVNFGAGSAIDSSFSPRDAAHLYFQTREEFWIPPEGYVPYAFEYVSELQVLRVWIALPGPFSYPAEIEHYDFAARHTVSGADQVRSCLTGTVVDVTEEAVSGAEVTFGGVTKRSDGTGTFDFLGIPAGRYDLVIRKAGFEELRETLVIQSMDAVRERFVMRSALFLEGTVVRAGSGTPIAGALVQVGTGSTKTDAAGHFVFRGLPAGDGSLIVTALGYSKVVLQFSLPEASPQPRRIELMPFGDPSVTSITARKYDGFLHFLQGVSQSVTLDVDVNWGHREPDAVTFQSTKSVGVLRLGDPASLTLDVGGTFQIGERLGVVAHSKDGAQSAQRYADFVVVPPPLASWEPSRFVVHDVPHGFEYTTKTKLAPGFFDRSVELGLVPAGTPFWEGMSFGLHFVPDLDCKVASSGRAEITLAWSDLPSEDDIDGMVDEIWSGYRRPSDLMVKLEELLGTGRISLARLPWFGLGLPCTHKEVAGRWFPYVKGDLLCNDGTLGWEAQSFEVGLAGELGDETTCYRLLPVPGLLLPLPVYANWSLKITGTVGGRFTVVDPPRFEAVGTLGVEGHVALGVGLDDFAAGELWAKGSMTAKFRWPDKPFLEGSEGELVFGWGVHFLTFHHQYPFHTTKWPARASGAPAAREAAGTPALTQIPRDRTGLPGAAAFLGAAGRAGRRIAAASAEPVFPGPERLVRDTYPYPELDLATRGTEAALVWLHDDTNRAPVNRTVVRSSFLIDGTWSEPADLEADGTGDFHPRVALLEGGAAIAVWEDAGVVLRDEVGLGEALAALEVSAAWFDPAARRWGPATRLTANGHLDRSPRIAAASPTRVVVLWVANPVSALVASTNAPDLVQAASWDGIRWSPLENVAQFDVPLLRFATVAVGDDVEVVYSVDVDGNRETVDDHELFHQRCRGGLWGPVARLTDDGLPDDNPQLFVDGRGIPILAWLRGGELSVADGLDLTGREVAGNPGYSSAVADFRAVAGVRGIEAFWWIGPGATTASDVWLQRRDAASGLWGEPRAVTADDAVEGPLAAGRLGPDSLLAVFSRRAAVSSNAVMHAGRGLDGSPEIRATDIVEYRHRDRSDPALLPGSLSVWPPNARSGATVEARVVVTNQGDRGVAPGKVVFLAVLGAERSELVRVSMPEGLRAGTASPVTAGFVMPPAGDSFLLQAVLDPGEELPDADRGNNRLELPVLLPDPRIESAIWHRSGSNEWTLVVLVGNGGGAASSPGRLEVAEASDGGRVLAVETLPALAGGATRELRFVLGVPQDRDPRDLEVRWVGEDPTRDRWLGNNSLRLRWLVPEDPPPLRLTYEAPDAAGNRCVLVFSDRRSGFTVEVSDDLRSWRPLREVGEPTTVNRVCDEPAVSETVRFYRARRWE